MLKIEMNYTELMEVLKAYYKTYYKKNGVETAINNLYYLRQCEITENLSLLEGYTIDRIADIIAYEPQKFMTEEEAEEFLNQ